MVPRTIAIIIFDGVELLDFCGPYEVFTTANRQSEEPIWNVLAVAQSREAVRTHNGLSVLPDLAIDDVSGKIDVLLVPGGLGTRKEMHNDRLLKWIATTAASADLVLFRLHWRAVAGQSRPARWAGSHNPSHGV